MVRPLLQLEKPWLTREQLEAAYWRVTGTRSVEIINTLLNLSDIYAASQGPDLAERIRERDRTSGTWHRNTDVLLRQRQARLTGEERLVLAEPLVPVPINGVESDTGIDDTEDSPGHDEGDPRLLPPQFKPERAADVWYGPDGTLWQFCTGCETGRPYSEFYNDKIRWNGKASRCKECKAKGISLLKDKKKAEAA
jgi:hypothetical protein